MSEEKIKIIDVAVAYDSPSSASFNTIVNIPNQPDSPDLDTDLNLDLDSTPKSETVWKWLSNNFSSGSHLYTGHQDRLNYDLVRSESREEPDAIDREFTYVNDNCLLIRLDKEVAKSFGFNTRYNRSSPWFQNLGQENEKFKPVVYAMGIKYIKKVNIPAQENGNEETSFKIYSQYGESTLNYFNSAIDLTEIHLPLSLNLMKEVKARQSEYARTNKFSNHLSSYPKIDSVGSFSCFGENLSKETFLQKAGNTPIKVIRLDSLYRGGGGKVSMKLEEARPQKIVKGGYVFPYLWKTQYLNQETRTWENAVVFCLGMFDDLSKVIKYKRSRDYIPRLLKDIEKFGGLKLFDPQEFEKQIAEKWGEHACYWEGLTELWEDLPEDAVVQDCIKPEAIEPKDLIFLQKANQISKTEEALSFKNIEQAYRDVENKVQGLKVDQKRAQDDYEYGKNRLEQRENEIVSLREQVEAYAKVEADKSKSINDYTQAKDILNANYNEAKIKYERYIEDIKTLDTSSKDISSVASFLSGLKTSGITINSITYKDYKNDEVYCIKDKPEVAMLAKESEELTKRDNYRGEYKIKRWQLESVDFTLAKPVIIRVDQGKDGDNCRKIVGGPYIVNVSRNSLLLSLATTTACFGHQLAGDRLSATLYTHPHTQSFSCTLDGGWEAFTKSLLGRKTSACLGEASPAVHKAFEDQDPKRVVFAAMTWISNANSTDAWGKNWKYFPRLEDVSLEKRTKVIPAAQQTIENTLPENLVTSEQGMDKLSELASELLSNINNPQILTVEPEPEPTAMPESIEVNTPVETTPPVDNTESITVSQPVGVNGYTRLSSLRNGSNTEENSTAENSNSFDVSSNEESVNLAVSILNRSATGQPPSHLPIEEHISLEPKSSFILPLTDEELNEQLSNQNN